jgi:hypothetical protein
MPVIGIEKYHLSQMYKNHLNYYILSQVLFRKIVIIIINQEIPIMMCQTELKSKENYTDQHIGSRTLSKMHNINNLSVQNPFFTLHDAMKWKVSSTRFAIRCSGMQCLS